MNLSLRHQLFFQSMLFSSVLLFLIGGYLATFLFQQEIHATHNLIKSHNQSINLFIEGYLNEISHTIEFLAADTNVQNGDLDTNNYKKKALHIYNQIQNSNENIMFVYSAYQGKGALVNNYVAPDDYVAEKRPWYIAAEAAFPRLSIGEPYQDSLYQTWLIATSKALERDGKIYGVVSIDCSVATLLLAIQNSVKSPQSFESFIVNQKGEIIIHPNIDLLGKTIQDVFAQDFQFTDSQGYLEIINNKSALFYSTLKNNGWIIITTTPINDLEAPILKNILACLSTIALFCLLWGYAQSFVLSKRIAEPLAALKRQVHNIIGGQVAEKYTYPKNDIGHIAHEVASIVSGKIYAAHAEVTLINQELTLANKALEKEQRNLEILANTDPLTGMYNRYRIDKCLEQEWQRSKRYSTVFSVMIIDIDHFKGINDTYGHQQGDLVLKRFARIILENIRQSDSAGRWGGEEFIVILPETDLEKAREVANKLRDIIENHIFSVERRITMSAGLGQFDHNHSLNTLLKVIDQRLYKAKESGRNMVVSDN